MDGALRQDAQRSEEVRRVEHPGSGRVECGARARGLEKSVVIPGLAGHGSTGVRPGCGGDAVRAPKAAVSRPAASARAPRRADIANATSSPVGVRRLLLLMLCLFGLPDSLPAQEAEDATEPLKTSLGDGWRVDGRGGRLGASGAPGAPPLERQLRGRGLRHRGLPTRRLMLRWSLAAGLPRPRVDSESPSDCRSDRTHRDSARYNAGSCGCWSVGRERRASRPANDRGHCPAQS